jgi:hypothetical protein
MQASELGELVSRIRRAMTRVDQRSGIGATWQVEIPDFGTQKYTLNGVKDFAEMKDDIANLTIWIWSLKDYLKEWATENGHDPQMIEAFVNQNPELCLCADLANTFKHGSLDRQRSTAFSRIGDLQYTLQHDAGETITLLPYEVVVDVPRADKVEVTLPLLDDQDNEIGEACSVLDSSMKLWERLMASIGVAA